MPNKSSSGFERAVRKILTFQVPPRKTKKKGKKDEDED